MSNIHKHGFKQLTPIDKAWKVLVPYIKLLSEEKINTIQGLRRILYSDVVSPINVLPIYVIETATGKHGDFALLGCFGLNFMPVTP